jgi:hypothetical protein
MGGGVTADRLQLQKAIWSVSFHAHGHRSSAVPRPFRPLPLDDALEVIFQSRERAAALAHWALQKLGKAKIAPDLHSQALRGVGRTKAAAIVRSRRRLPDAVARSLLHPGDPDGCRRSLEEVCKSLRPEAEKDGCSFEIGPCTTDFDSATGTVSLKSASKVNKPIDRCLFMLDPRNWGRCSPFFDGEKTYKIKCDAGGRPLRDRKGELIRDPVDDFGEPWQGLMRERFDGHGIAVENILDIDFAVFPEDRSDKDPVTGARMSYSLYSCERCQLGLLSERGGLRKNSGGMEAAPVNGGKGTEVVVTKTVRYKDFTPGNEGRFFDLGESLNVWASVLLCARADDEAVFNLCCEP